MIQGCSCCIKKKRYLVTLIKLLRCDVIVVREDKVWMYHEIMFAVMVMEDL